jgi:hypothetical protein
VTISLFSADDCTEFTLVSVDTALETEVESDATAATRLATSFVMDAVKEVSVAVSVDTALLNTLETDATEPVRVLISLTSAIEKKLSVT